MKLKCKENTATLGTCNVYIHNYIFQVSRMCVVRRTTAKHTKRAMKSVFVIRGHTMLSKTLNSIILIFELK